jgi:hypothetical protein
VRHALAITTLPFTCVLLLARADVIFMDVVNEAIHVTEIPCAAACPLTHGDLLVERVFVVMIWVVDAGGGRRRY